MALKHLGTEEYKDGRYGFAKVSYYLDGDMIEERKLQTQAKQYIVRRHIGFTPQEIAGVATAIAAADGVQAKSSKKHDAIGRLLHSKPSVAAYIDASEIDKPGRTAIVCTSTNMPNTVDFNDFNHYFVINAD